MSSALGYKTEGMPQDQMVALVLISQFTVATFLKLYVLFDRVFFLPVVIETQGGRLPGLIERVLILSFPAWRRARKERNVGSNSHISHTERRRRENMVDIFCIHV
jgi:hypothetical protein